MAHKNADTENKNNEGQNALSEAYDTSVQSGPYKLGL